MRKAPPLILLVLLSLWPGPSPAQNLASAGHTDYPLAAKAAGIEGSVKLKGTIGKDGVMRDIRVLSGPSVFQDAAVKAVMEWRYRPPSTTEVRSR